MTHGIPAQEKQEPYQPTWESLYQHDAAPQWYEDAVLGFYFHWGPYSVPATDLRYGIPNSTSGTQLIWDQVLI